MVNPQVAGYSFYSLPMTAAEKKKRVHLVKGIKTKVQLGKPPARSGRFEGQSATAEAVKTSSSLVVSKALNTMANVSALLTNVPYVGEVASIATPALKIGASIASSLGFDKPQSVALPTTTFVEPYDNIASGKGLDLGKSLGLMPDNKVATDTSIFGDDKDYTKIAAYAGIPALVMKYDIISPVQGDVIAEWPVCPSFCYTGTGTAAWVNMWTTPAMAVAMRHRYWKGGMKYMIHVTSSKYVTGRIRIAWLPSVAHKPSDTSDGAGDYISKIFDINGDSVITFMIPYLRPTKWCESAPLPVIEDGTVVLNQHQTVNGLVQISVLNEFTYTDPAVVPPVSLNIYSSAAEDFRVAMPKAPWANTFMGIDSFMFGDMEGQAIAEGDLLYPRQIFRNTFEPLVGPIDIQIDSGICHGEEISSLLSVGHRYTQRGPKNSVTWSGTNLWTILDPSLDYNTGGDYIEDQKWFFDNMFLFSRGSKRLMISCEGNTTTTRVNIWVKPTEILGLADSGGRDVLRNTSLTGEDGMVIADMQFRPNCYIHIPFDTTTVMRQNKYQFPQDYAHEIIPRFYISAPSGTLTAYTFRVYESLGDDFRYGWPKTPFPTYWLKPSATQPVADPTRWDEDVSEAHFKRMMDLNSNVNSPSGNRLDNNRHLALKEENQTDPRANAPKKRG